MSRRTQKGFWWRWGGGCLAVACCVLPAYAEPDVMPAGAPVPGGFVPVNPGLVQPVWSGLPLAVIQSAAIQGGRFRLITDVRGLWRIKGQFVLGAPGRYVIDLENTRLLDAGLPFPANYLGNVPVTAIRLAQFTDTTVRIVIETPQPERLRASLERNRLTVEALPSPGLFGGFYQRITGNRPSPSPAPNALPPSIPAVVTGNPAVLGPAPPPPAGTFPNLEKLQRVSVLPTGPLDFPASMSAPPPVAMTPPPLPFRPYPRLMGAELLQRGRILEAARSQLGLSKDLNREYVTRTFSNGQDQAWCADFVSTILDWAGGSPWGHFSRVQDIYDWGLSHNRLTLSPAPGNVAIFTYGGGAPDHAAFIESVNPDSTFSTIGGNEGYAAGLSATGSVARASYRLNDRRVLGFVDPVSQPPNAIAPPPVSPSSVMPSAFPPPAVSRSLF